MWVMTFCNGYTCARKLSSCQNMKASDEWKMDHLQFRERYTSSMMIMIPHFYSCKWSLDLGLLALTQWDSACPVNGGHWYCGGGAQIFFGEEIMNVTASSIKGGVQEGPYYLPPFLVVSPLSFPFFGGRFDVFINMSINNINWIHYYDILLDVEYSEQKKQQETDKQCNE